MVDSGHATGSRARSMGNMLCLSPQRSSTGIPDVRTTLLIRQCSSGPVDQWCHEAAQAKGKETQAYLELVEGIDFAEQVRQASGNVVECCEVDGVEG